MDSLSGAALCEGDDGSEPPPHALAALALPPGGSPGEAQLRAGSRLCYALCTVCCCGALSDGEVAWLARPMGGGATFLGGGGGAQLRFAPAVCFPFLHPFSPSAVRHAAALLRRLWDAAPLLRTGLAHVAAATLLAVAARLGAVTVHVALPGGAPGVDVEVTEEVVAARYLGVGVERLAGPPAAQGRRPGGGGGGGSGGGGGGGGRHPLATAVEGRVRGAELRRLDGVVVITLDVELPDESFF
jgi:hypothetical protein